MNKNKNNKKNTNDQDKDFIGQEVGDLEIIPPQSYNSIGQVIVESSDNDNAVSIDKEKVQVKKSGNLVVGNLNLVLNPFKRRGEKYYQQNFWHLIADVFLLALVIALIVFLIIVNRWQPKRNINLNIINNNEEISSGSLVSFELEYQSNIKASQSSIRVIWPENFIIESVSPNNLFNFSNNTFDLGDLGTGSSGKIKVLGFVRGNINDHQMIAFNFDCDQCGKNGFGNSLFYNIDKNAIDFAFEVNDGLYLNSEFEGFISLKNNTNNSFNNIKINLGQDINIRKSNFSIENGEIIVDKIDGYENKIIDVWAIPNKGGRVDIKPKININLLDQNFSFSGKELFFDVKTPGFKLSIVGDRNNVKEGEKIEYVLNYKNEEKETIKNIKINLSSANPNFSLVSMTASDLKNSQINDNSIIIYDLIENESGSISLEVLFDRRQISPNQELFLRADLEYQVDGQFVRYRADSNKNKLISRVSTIANAYYYSPQGDQLGVGPLPPAVDMATNYWIFLEFNNLGNELENFVLTAELPENVYFSDNKRVLDGRLIYGEIGKRLVWEIPVIAGGSNKYRANFEITLIPGSSDLGTIPSLLEKIKFTVKDSFVDQELSGNLSNINTDLKNDKLSSGKGRVINIR